MSNEKTNQNDDLMYVSKQHNCAKNIIVSSEFRSNVITFFMGCIPWEKKKRPNSIEKRKIARKQGGEGNQ